MNETSQDSEQPQKAPKVNLNREEYQRDILVAMQTKPMYGGTVDPVKVQERRTKNRVAKKSRQINRRRKG